jgi:hypothetical protein
MSKYRINKSRTDYTVISKVRNKKEVDYLVLKNFLKKTWMD